MPAKGVQATPPSHRAEASRFLRPTGTGSTPSSWATGTSRRVRRSTRRGRAGPRTPASSSAPTAARRRPWRPACGPTWSSATPICRARRAGGRPGGGDPAGARPGGQGRIRPRARRPRGARARRDAPDDPRRARRARFDHALANAWLLALPALAGRAAVLLDATDPRPAPRRRRSARLGRRRRGRRRPRVAPPVRGRRGRLVTDGLAVPAPRRAAPRRARRAGSRTSGRAPRRVSRCGPAAC